MAMLGLISGVLIGAIFGAANHATFIGMVLGGVIGLLLQHGKGNTAGQRLDPAMEEIEKLRALMESRQKELERKLFHLRERISILESGNAVKTVPVEPAPSAPVVEPDKSEQVAPAKISVEPAFEPAFTFEAELKTEDAPPDPPKIIASIHSQVTSEKTPEKTERVKTEPRPIEPIEPIEPYEPSLVERAVTGAKEWLFGGNTIVRMGVVLVFLGLAFLLRYASDRVVIPVELRYMGVAATALVALGLGWRLRESRRSYGLLMQGAAVAVMYLTIFAAMRLHHILPMQGGFLLLVAVAVLAAILAITQDALALALAGSLGGFAAPILASSGGGSHVALFSYFALLNTGILGIAWFKAWRPLNMVGFFGTFLIGLTWGLRSYQSEYYLSCQLFLILFFLMFVGIGLLFARRVLLDDLTAPKNVSADAWWNWVKQQGSNLNRYVDGTLLFGPPLVGFGLQYGLLKETEYGAAFSALALGAFYIALAWLVYGRSQTALRLLVEVFLSLGVIFATLAIPLGLEAQWTTAAWAVEGAGIYWIGHRQGRALGRAFALLLQTGAIVTWLTGLQPGTESLLSGSVLGTLLLGLSMLCNALTLRIALQEKENTDNWDRNLRPQFNTLGLWFIYLMAPMLFKAQGTAMAWSLAGLFTVIIGLHLQAQGWLVNSLIVQLLAGAVFLIDLQYAGATDATGVLALGGSGWRGLVVAALIGFAALFSVFLAVRLARQNNDSVLEQRMGWLMLYGLAFMALAALFVLPWATVTSIWAGCGFLLFVLALWLSLRPAFWFALALQVVAGIAYLLTNMPNFPITQNLTGTHIPAFSHSGFWTPVIIALAAFLVAWQLARYGQNGPKPAAMEIDGDSISIPLLGWSSLWWGFAWWTELYRLLPDLQAGHVFLCAMAITGLVLNSVARIQNWAGPVWIGSITLPLAAVIWLFDYSQDLHPFGEWGGLAFALVMAVHLFALTNSNLLRYNFERLIHLAGLWVTMLALSLEMRHLLLALSEPGSSWRWLGWVLPLVLWLLWSARKEPARIWPMSKRPDLYRFSATFPLILILFAWVAASALKSAGNAAPLPYVPLANPLEIAQILVLFSGWQWSLNLAEDHKETIYAGFAKWLKPVLLGLAFLCYTMAVLRANHHMGGVPWHTETLVRSMSVQASLSIFWSLLALGLMITGHRSAQRIVWAFGAGLVAVVVVKLFFIELSNRGGLERIVSFIGVGILLLIVGYFAPLPPAKKETE